MDTLQESDERDEELGTNNVNSRSVNDDDLDRDPDASEDSDGDREGEANRSVASASGPGRRLTHFFSRFLRSDTGVSSARRRGSSNGEGGGREGGAEEEQPYHVQGGKWTSLGSRRIRFASRRYSDIEDNEVRGIVATPLDSDLARPMGTGARFLANVQAEVEDRFGGDSDDDEDGSGEGGRRSQMYRLQATRGSSQSCCTKTLRFVSALVNCGALTQSATEQNLYHGFGNPNQWLIYFFFWLFRKGWATVVILSVVWYYVFVLFFALLIVWAAKIDLDCVRIGGKRFGDLENRSMFMDSFSLSWNTFSTVGYGSTYPALSGESGESEGGDARCAFINFITSFEALVGVVFAGFIGAVFYAKVSRITQRADVIFSDPLTVRFGTGVDLDLGEADDEENLPQNEVEEALGRKKDEAEVEVKEKETPNEKFRSLAKKAAEKATKPSPFPVITFRIANEMHGTLGGEIISASVNAVVLIESTKYDDQVSEDLAKQIAMHRVTTNAKRRSSMVHHTARSRKSTVGLVGASLKNLRNNGSDDSSEIRTSIGTAATDISLEEDASSERSKRGADNAMNYLQGLNALAYKARHGGKKMKIDEEEGTGSKIVPRMVFTKLNLETSEHPLFKRIWRFKHIIGPDSPLLTCEAQKAIIENNGNWRPEWNNHKYVRKAIRFNQMVVSFTGISNISGASVYKQKVYDYVDTVVGYQFVNALYRGRRGNLKVDLRLINDVAEQNGGGGEPLHVAGRGAPSERPKET